MAKSERHFVKSLESGGYQGVNVKATGLVPRNIAAKGFSFSRGQRLSMSEDSVLEREILSYSEVE